MNESQKHYEEWTKLGMKEYMLYDSIYMKFTKKENKCMVVKSVMVVAYGRCSLVDWMDIRGFSDEN